MIKHIEVDDEGNSIIDISQEALELGWQVGDVLQWEDNHDGSWSIRKKMTDFVSKVKEFNTIAGTDEVFDTRKVALYIGLCLEEMAELIAAIPSAGASELIGLHSTMESHSTRFKSGVYDSSVANIDRVEAVDAFVDIAVVALGGGIATGADIVGACHAVADNNLSKFPSGEDGKRRVLKDANGKVQKPPDYQSVDLTPFVKD